MSQLFAGSHWIVASLRSGSRNYRLRSGREAQFSFLADGNLVMRLIINGSPVTFQAKYSIGDGGFRTSEPIVSLNYIGDNDLATAQVKVALGAIVGASRESGVTSSSTWIDVESREDGLSLTIDGHTIALKRTEQEFR